ncbi:MAG: NTP transferase domain-containing protein [Limisphaerales bacterium]
MPGTWLPATPAAEAFILAGGESSRMGRDKAGVRLGGRTLLAWAKAAAREAGLPVRIVRRDAVPAGGPVGGVVTGLRQARADVVVFLACDQPFVPAAWLRRLARAARTRAAFPADAEGRVGFPFAVPAGGRPAVEAFWEEGGRALQALATALQARRLQASGRQAAALQNLNTPHQLAAARAARLISRRAGGGPRGPVRPRPPP